MKLRWLILALLSLPAFAANAVYIGQSSAGSGDGSSCANQKAYTYFNTAGNWSASPTGVQIGPDTTVHLCGTINGPNTAGSTVFTFQGSGTTGHRVILLWETGASISVPSCASGIGGNNSGCINIGSQSHILINGNCTAGAGATGKSSNQCVPPSITNTANGTGKANQLDSMGIFDAGLCNDCEFENLTISHLYDHTSTSDGVGQFGYGIQVRGGVKILAHDNAFLDDVTGFDDAYENGDSDLEFYNNWCNRYNWCFHVGQNSTSAIDTVLLHHNHLGDMANWDTVGDNFHHDGLFPVQNNAGASYTNLAIYNNYADGDPGTCCMTAWIFLNTGMHGPMIFNNVLLNPTGHSGGNGFLIEGGFPGDTNYSIFNNYGDCNGLPGGVNFSNVAGFKMENNAFQGCGTYKQLASLTSTTIDYNVYKNFASGETHSINTANLNVTSVGVPNVGSPLLHNGTSVFLNLTASCTGVFAPLCSDFSGVARPNTSFAWDSGAYQVGPSFAISPSTVPANHAGSITLTLTGTGTSWNGSTAFSVSGVSGTSLVSCSNTTATAETCSITTGAGTGTATLTDTTDSINSTFQVAQAATPTCDHASGTYFGSFSNSCSTVTTGTVILCWATGATTPATNGDGATCSVGTPLANNGSTTIVVSETFNIIAGVNGGQDSSVQTYVYTVNANIKSGTISNGAQIWNGAVIR